MGYQARRATIIVLIVLTLILAGVTIFVAVSIQNSTPDENVSGGTLPKGSACDPANDQCSGSLVCTPNDQGQNVCNDPGTGNGCPTGETCSRIIAFTCPTLAADGTCSQNKSVVNSFSEGVTYANGCGQVDTVCSKTDKLCGAFQVIKDRCGGAETKYKCDTTNYKCVVDTNGEYSTEGACEDACVKAEVKYRCNMNNYTCVEDTNGDYKTMSKCEENCVKPEAKYRCDSNTFTCIVDTNGTYTSKSSCDQNCVAPKYSCDTATFTCIASASGAYTNSTDCLQNCVPQFCGQPCGGKDGVSCPINHVCDTVQRKCVLISCLNNPECTNNGCKLPETAIYGDSRDYVIYGAFLILIGLLVYRLRILPLSLEIIGFGLQNSIDNKDNLQTEDLQTSQFKKEREKFESKFKNR